MHRIWCAIRIFFLVLFKKDVAGQVDELLARRAAAEPAAPETPTAPPKPAAPPKPSRSARSEAVTLMATLQREARFVDFIMEPLDGYSDAQIGAAARDVHRECGKVLNRLFSIEPVLAQEEGSQVEVPPGFDAGRFRLVGNVAGEPPFRGRLVHHGWEAAACQLPAWSGTDESVRIVAPVEVELA